MDRREDEQLIGEFERALLSLDRTAAKRILNQTRHGRTPIHTVEALVAPALERIGLGWEEGRVALSQIYMSGRICEELVEAILPAADQARKARPRLAIAVVEDYHQLGKRIVTSVLRANGFSLLDYGHGIGAAAVAERAVADGVDVLLLSALMLPSALRVKRVSARLAELGAKVKVVVGGAPFLFDDLLWQEVGAHAMGHSASEAVSVVNRLSEGLA